MVDLGAGSGRLTDALARRAGRVVAVELDPQLAQGLRNRWENVRVVEGDAAFVALPREPFRVVANLPFDRTTDLLHRLLDDPATPLVRADLVVQWGVALKHALPWPSSVNGVLWGAWYEVELARRLPRTAFSPPPTVDAGVLVLRRRVRPLVPAELARPYRQFVAGAFRRSGAAREFDAHAWAERYLRQIRRRPRSRARASR